MFALFVWPFTRAGRGVARRPRPALSERRDRRRADRRGHRRRQLQPALGVGASSRSRRRRQTCSVGRRAWRTNSATVDGAPVAQGALEDPLPRPPDRAEVGIARMQLDAQQRIARAPCARPAAFHAQRRAPPPRARGAVDDALARHALAARQANDAGAASPCTRSRSSAGHACGPSSQAGATKPCSGQPLLAKPGDAGVDARLRLGSRAGPRTRLRRACSACGAGGRAGAGGGRSSRCV